MLSVTLGGISFKLSGLDRIEVEGLKEMWGPFITSVDEMDEFDGIAYQDTASQDTASQDTLSEIPPEWFISLCSPRGPLEIDTGDIDYRRGVDLALACREARYVESWTDRSLGALEATLQVTLQWALEEVGGLLVHASAGVYQNEGWLIPGVSGAGKSTAAREGGFDTILSDELVIVRPSLSSHKSSAAYRLYSTPFWSEGRSAPLIVSDAPLSAITFPHKAGVAELRACSDAQAVMSLLSAVTLYERERDATAAGSGVSCEITQRAALFERTCHIVEQSACAILAFPRFGPWRSRLSRV